MVRTEVQERFRGRTVAELRERAETVAAAVGVPPRAEGGWARYAWTNGGGDSAVWFFHDDGRVLLLTVDHESDLNLYDEDAPGLRDLYRGIPDDMLDLVVGPDDEEPLITMALDGTRVTFATGVFWFDGGTWRIADGLAERIEADEKLELIDTGIGFCLSPYDLGTAYEPGAFTFTYD